jgi:hypothetical protein
MQVQEQFRVEQINEWRRQDGLDLVHLVVNIFILLLHIYVGLSVPNPSGRLQVLEQPLFEDDEYVLQIAQIAVYPGVPDARDSHLAALHYGTPPPPILHLDILHPEQVELVRDHPL